MKTVAFEYRLTGTGWAEARLQLGPAWTALSASYLDDALGDLVRATAALARGAREVRVSWAEEPGEFRWILISHKEVMDVTVLEFDELWSDAEDDRGTQLLRGSCSRRAFCMAVADGAQRVLDEHGLAGYRSKWVGHDFPEEALRDLPSAL